ncbi:MAG: lysozyme inhibitor LprI family protein [Thalassotalea sp.]
MKIKKTFILLLSTSISLLFISNFAVAKLANTVKLCEQQNPKDDDLAFCLDRVKNLVDKELTTWVNNQVFNLEELKKVTGRGAALNIFNRSQAHFVTFREDNCRWQYLQIAPATGAAVAYKKCYIQLTQARSDELASLNR